ncbi:MAG: UvrD/REP helicase, partial [Veillonella sp. DORA_A_3_16_22]
MFPDLVGSIYTELPRANSERKGKPVLIKGCKNSYLEGRYIYEAICALPKDANIGVLVRDNKKAQRLSDSFERLNNEKPEDERRHFMIIDEFKFFRRQEIKDVMAYFKLLMNPNDS